MATRARGAPPKSYDTPAAAPHRHRSRAAGFVPPRWVRWIVFALALLPAAWVIGAIASDYFNGTRLLGSNPIDEAEHFSGRWTLRFLMITLAVTPVRQLLGWNWLQRYRRMFGLFTFFYASLHLTIYALLDLELMWGEVFEDILERPYITIGMTAFVLMIPLAVTSTAKMVKRLGGKRWARLHRAVYVIAVLGTIHFWMSQKRDITDPFIYATLFAVLLGYRVVVRRRKQRAATTATAPRTAPAPGG